MQRYTLECCVDSVESALAAEKGGATRLELCSALVVGGLSPSVALFRAVKEQCNLPINVLLRPRYGDFCYTDAEIEVLRREVELFCAEGANGVVIGCLAPDGTLHEKHMQSLISVACCKEITLHRAFDMCADPMAALRQAQALGITTILTSGAQNNCRDGKALLTALTNAAQGTPEILVGAGVSANVIAEFLRDTPLKCFHMSGKEVLQSAMKFRNPHVSMGAASLNEYEIWRTSAENIEKAAKVLQAAL